MQGRHATQIGVTRVGRNSGRPRQKAAARGASLDTRENHHLTSGLYIP